MGDHRIPALRRAGPVPNCTFVRAIDQHLDCQNNLIRGPVLNGPDGHLDAYRKLNALGLCQDSSLRELLSPKSTAVGRWFNDLCSPETGSIDRDRNTITLGAFTFQIEGEQIPLELLFVMKESLRTLPEAQLQKLSTLRGGAPVAIVFGNAAEFNRWYRERAGKTDDVISARANEAGRFVYDATHKVVLIVRSHYEEVKARPSFPIAMLSQLLLHELAHAVDDALAEDGDQPFRLFSEAFQAQAEEIMDDCRTYAGSDYCEGLPEAFAEGLSWALFVGLLDGWEDSRNPIPSHTPLGNMVRKALGATP